MSGDEDDDAEFEEDVEAEATAAAVSRKLQLVFRNSDRGQANMRNWAAMEFSFPDGQPPSLLVLRGTAVSASCPPKRPDSNPTDLRTKVRVSMAA